MNFIMKRHTVPCVIPTEEDERESELLQTIRIPIDINSLTTKLPAPNYRDEFKLANDASDIIYNDPALPKISLKDKFQVRESVSFKESIQSRRAIESKSVEPSLEASISKGSYSPVNNSYKEILINNYGSIRLPKINNSKKQARYSTLKRSLAIPTSYTPTPDIEIEKIYGSNLSSSSRRAGVVGIRHPKAIKNSSKASN
jgi:hypothetical protein